MFQPYNLKMRMVLVKLPCEEVINLTIQLEARAARYSPCKFSMIPT